MNGKTLLKTGDEFWALSVHPYGLGNDLQGLLERHPELIPGDQINPETPPDFVLLGREIYAGPGSGSIELLLGDQNAILTFVETKLHRNPEAHREVIGQLSD